MDQDALGTEVCLGPGDIVLDRDPALFPTERGTAALPHYSAHVYCGQTAKCSIPLGTEVGLDQDVTCYGGMASALQATLW